jgi:hypothetical protein
MQAQTVCLRVLRVLRVLRGAKRRDSNKRSRPTHPERAGSCVLAVHVVIRDGAGASCASGGQSGQDDARDGESRGQSVRGRPDRFMPLRFGMARIYVCSARSAESPCRNHRRTNRWERFRSVLSDASWSTWVGGSTGNIRSRWKSLRMMRTRRPRRRPRRRHHPPMRLICSFPR